MWQSSTANCLHIAYPKNSGRFWWWTDDQVEYIAGVFPGNNYLLFCNILCMVRTCICLGSTQSLGVLGFGWSLSVMLVMLVVILLIFKFVQDLFVVWFRLVDHSAWRGSSPSFSTEYVVCRILILPISSSSSKHCNANQVSTSFFLDMKTFPSYSTQSNVWELCNLWFAKYLRDCLFVLEGAGCFKPYTHI